MLSLLVPLFIAVVLFALRAAINSNFDVERDSCKRYIIYTNKLTDNPKRKSLSAFGVDNNLPIPHIHPSRNRGTRPNSQITVLDSQKPFDLDISTS